MSQLHLETTAGTSIVACASHYQLFSETARKGALVSDNKKDESHNKQTIPHH
jgi:hypothetical protein